MANIKFTQLPNLTTPTADTIVPVVKSNVNYTVTANTLTAYVNQNSTDITASGNITGNYFIGNGSQLTGLGATYGNANVAAFLPVYGGNVGAQSISNSAVVNSESAGFVQMQYAPTLPADPYAIGTGSWLYVDATGAAFESNTTGTVNSVYFNNDGSLSATGNVSGNYILGNGSQLTGLPATYGNANVVTLLSAFGSNTVSTTGNITAGYVLGNGSQLTGLAATYGNANVVTLMSAFGSNTISTTGNITANNFVGLVANATYAVSSGTAVTATSAASAAVATTAGTVTTNAQPNITSVGILNSLSASGNITGAYFFGNGSQLTGTYGNTQVANFLTNLGSNNVSTTGSVSAAIYIGEGSGLSNIVTKITAGTGITVSGSTGNVTITNSGSSSTSKVAGSFATGTLGTTTETISASVLIPGGTFSTNTNARIITDWLNNNGSTYQRWANVYVNTSNAIPSTSLQLQSYLVGSGPSTFSRSQIILDVIATNGNTRGFLGQGSSGTLSSVGKATSLGENNVSSGPAYFNISWGSNQYIIFTTRNVNGTGTDGATCVGYQIYKE